MTKKPLIIFSIFILLVIIGLVVWFLFFNKNGKIEIEQIPETKVDVIEDQEITDQSQEPAQIFVRTAEPFSDADADGVSDEKEAELGLNETEFDTDNDGLSDYIEIQIGTDPKKFDTDGDGYSDGVEVVSGYNPLGEGAL